MYVRLGQQTDVQYMLYYNTSTTDCCSTIFVTWSFWHNLQVIQRLQVMGSVLTHPVYGYKKIYFSQILAG